MKKIQTLLFIFLTIVVNRGFSQQAYSNNYYHLFPFTINPAVTGMHNNVTGFLNYRDQWSGLKGAPEIVTLGVQGMVNNSMGLGLTINQNKTGVFKQFIAEMNYSYKYSIDKSQAFAFGLMFGFLRNNINFEEVLITEGADPALYSSSIINETLVRIGFGIHYKWEGLNLHFSSPIVSGIKDNGYFKNGYGLVSYEYELPDKIWRLKPSVLYQYIDSKENQIDLNILAEYNQMVWMKTTYKTNGNLVIGAGVFIDNIGISYNYEINLSELSGVGMNSHEIMVYFKSDYSAVKSNTYYKNSNKRKSWY